MKRDINLQELSRDHHHGLLLGWKIRQGLKLEVDPVLMVEYIRYFFVNALLPHFDEEEKQILKYLEEKNGYKVRILKEHLEITSLVEALADKESDPAAFLEIAELLDAHIRYEERELFPYLQEQLSADQLNLIGSAIAAMHKPFVETFQPEFWNAGVN